MQVLRRWAMDPPPDVRLLVVVDRAVAVYSGMVPGFVAGDYAMHELEIDVLPLARRAGAGVILAAATDLDPVRREIALEGRPPIRFDLASLDVGSTVRGLDLPGVAEHALRTRPIGDFVREVDARVERLAEAGGAPRVLIVGGGAAGSELAFTLDARLRARGLAPRIAVISGASELLEGMPERARRRLAREAARRGIELLPERRVVRVEKGAVLTTRIVDGPGPEVRPDRRGDVGPASTPSPGAGEDRTESLEADLVVWATGAAPHAFPRGAMTSEPDAGAGWVLGGDAAGDADAMIGTDPEAEPRGALVRDERGFLAIRETLQAVGHDAVFAVGDCARLVDHPWVPRAGVYAVRQGPVLERNLRAWLAGRPLERYVPQRDFLALLHLGQGRALASKWGRAAAGAPLLWLKDRIDRRFMRRFQVLDPQGHPTPELAELGAMGRVGAEGEGEGEDPEMACGGCAAKLGADALEAALSALPPAPPDETVLLGVVDRRDVGATRDESGRTTLHNVDVIRAFCDDPWLVGRVAARNALGDLEVCGGRPRHAQAVVGLPEQEPRLAREILFQALSGIRSVLDDEGVSLLGGHTTIGDALTIGLAVTGEGPGGDGGDCPTRLRPREGDAILLTRPLGTGVVLAADMRGLARSDWLQATWASMLRGHAVVARLVRESALQAATDVTGFGLAGHLLSLLRGTPLCARLASDTIPLLPGAELLWRDGLRSSAHPANRAAFGARIAGASELDEAWLFDPQTAGGALLLVSPDRLTACDEAFDAAGEPRPARIGRLFAEPDDQPRIEIHAATLPRP